MRLSDQELMVRHPVKNAGLVLPDRKQMTDALNAVLRERYGAGVWLGHWSARLLRKTQNRCVVLFDIFFRRPGAAKFDRHRWVGKFHEQTAVAARIATTLRALAATDCEVRGNMSLPRVIAYDESQGLVLLQYLEGEPVLDALARYRAEILPAMGRALAALHSTGLGVEKVTTPAALLCELRGCVAGLCAHFPDEAMTFRSALAALERSMPPIVAAAGFLHGDFGPGQLLWQNGRLVVLDFDRCTRGDPAFDLGNLLAQLQRISFRELAKLPDFAWGRKTLMDGYQQWAGVDPELGPRVAWYQLAVLIRKIHYLAQHETADRRADANLLLRGLPGVMAMKQCEYL